MLNIGLLSVGSVKDKNILLTIERYQKMLKPYLVFQSFEVKSERFIDSSKLQAQRDEQQRLMDFVKNLQQKNSWQPILLTETGKKFDSKDLAGWLAAFDKAPLFILGGALGFDEKFKASFKFKLSLSDLTLPHELAHLVLIEQLYRTATILNGKSYHY